MAAPTDRAPSTEVGAATADDVIEAFTFAADRLVARLEGLDDDELFWAPVADCWTVREVAPGTWAMDGGDVEGYAPVTTIAWRIAHLAGHVLGGFATWLLDGGSPYGADGEVPHTASGSVALLERNLRRFDEGLGRLDAAGWRREIGEQFGPYADSRTAALVLHVLDEFVHHAAEVSLLRDLYRARGGATPHD
jgi:hypothetical protein